MFVDTGGSFNFLPQLEQKNPGGATGVLHLGQTMRSSITVLLLDFRPLVRIHHS